MPVLLQVNKAGNCQYDLEIKENLVIAHIDKTEIFRAEFIPNNFIEKYKIVIQSEKPNERIYNLARDSFEHQGAEKTEEEINQRAEYFNEEILNIVAEEFIGHIAECISNNLPSLVAALLDDAIKGYTINAGIELHNQVGRKFNIEDIKKIVLKTYWSGIAQKAGIKRGGYRGEKGFWDEEKKINFYEKVEFLPKVKGKNMWKYIFDELVDVDFDSPTQNWLKQRPELQIIPNTLFNEAIGKWRKYYSVREIKENNEKLRFFEYRLALHLLEYPDEFEYSSLDTYYKQGKILIKNRDSQT